MTNLILFNNRKEVEVKTISSIEVAKMTDKRHDHLLRDIKGYLSILEPNPNLGADSFFFESTYIDQNNQERKCYQLTKKGCDFVANKMTGEKGTLFTATYINRFEEMENHIKKQELVLDSYMINDPIERAKVWITEQEKIQVAQQEAVLAIEEKEKAQKEVELLVHTGKMYTSTDIAKELQMKSAQVLNKILNEKKIIFFQSGQWHLYSRYTEKGLTETKQFIKPFGGVEYTLKWTGKGRKFLLELLSKEKLQVSK